MTQVLDPEIGIIIAILRTSLAWRQADLARAANLPASTISEYERGRRRPKLHTLERLVTSMGMDLSAIERTRSFLAEARALYGLPSEKDREEVAELVRKLNHYAPKNRPMLVRDATEFKSWALSEHFSLQSTELAAEDTAAAVEAAELAVAIAEALPGQSPWTSKVRWHAWAHLGNVRRAVGNLRTADEAFRTAERFWQAGRRDPTHLLEEALVLAMKAALRRAQRRLPEALEFLEAALTADQRQTLRGTILISKSKAVEELGDVDQAITLLLAAEPHVDRESDPRLYLCLRHNLAICLSKANRPEEAKALLPEVVALTRASGGELDHVRLHWTEARIAAGLGQPERAIELYNQVRSEFVRRGISYDAALVSLELATLYAERGCTDQVKALARHMVPIFQALDVHREAHVALAIFRQAAEAERATAELVRRVLDFLFQARHNAGLSFEG